MERVFRVLLVDDDEEEYLLTKELLYDRSFRLSDTENIRFQLDWTPSFQEALDFIREEEYDAYLVDYRMGDRDGLDLIRKGRELNQYAPLILMTGQGSYQVDVEAMKAGATDYLPKSEITAPLLERTIRYSIDRKRAERHILEHTWRVEMLAALSQAFAEARLEYPGVLETIVQRIASLMRDACIIRLLVDTEEGPRLKPVAYHHPNPQLNVELGEILNKENNLPEEGLAGQVFTTGMPLRIEKVTPEQLRGVLSADYTDFLLRAGLKSALILPLRTKGPSIIGTLGLQRYGQSQPFMIEDEYLLQNLADRAALTIENARLYQAEKSRARELDSLHRATAALLQTIDLEPLLGHILDVAQKAIPAAEKGALHLVVPETGQLQVRAATGYSGAQEKNSPFPRAIDYPLKAVRDNNPLLVEDTQSHPVSPVPEAGIYPSNLRSIIVAPLAVESTVLGSISLASSRPSAFTQADLRLLESFATTTTAAIKNAMLHAEVQKLAITDSLTEMYNRRGFFELARHEFERARRFGRPLTAVMMDIDRLKEVNDTYGHAAGDQVLKLISDRLRSSVREVDILGRYGGDEFVILLPETDLETASAVAERVRRLVSEPICLHVLQVGQVSFVVTSSLGVADLSNDTPDLTSLLERADKAAYTSKNLGRNRIEVG